jgi:hypothetical protein
MEPEERARDALELTALLRNKIHGEALSGIAVRRAGRPRENMVEVPSDIAKKLLTAASRLGSPDEWRITGVVSQRHYIEPGAYVEALMSHCGRALNELMAATDVDRLGADRTTFETEPPEGEFPWNEATRMRFRLLAGL